MAKKRDYVNHLVSRLEKPHYKPQHKWLRKNITAILRSYYADNTPLKDQADRIVTLAEYVAVEYEKRYE